MKTRQTRGVIDPGTWLVIGLISVGSYFYLKVLEPGRNKAVADKTASAAVQTTEQAKAVEERATAVKAAVTESTANHAKEIATRDKIDQNATGFVEAAKIAIQADPAPSQADLVALGLLDSATQALGQPFTAEQRAFWVKTVGGLIAKNTEAQQTVARMTVDAAALVAARDAEHAHAVSSDATAATLSAQLAKNTTQLAGQAAKASTLASQNKAWADNEQTLWGRIKALSGLAIILIIADGLISIKLSGVTKTRDNTVALVESMKKWAVEGVQDAADLKKKMTDWYENDTKAQNAVAKVKTKLRL